MDKLNEIGDFFITSDTWFGRDNILYIADRVGKYNSINEMNKGLIQNWNSKVGKDDIVFHLGNFAWDPNSARDALSKLNGKIYFICSNDDVALVDVIGDFDNAIILRDQILILPDVDIVLSHYPLDVWPGKVSGTIHIHGHTVYSHKTDLFINKVNACTDFWNYSPFKFSTIKEFINETKENNI